MRRIPQRTCVACREVNGKRELIRLVRTADGGVEIDATGRKAGRGAYLCRSWQCWENGLKSGRLEHALKVSLTGDRRQQLINSGEEYLAGVNCAQGS
ncbi:RNase P modulator RnpM [Chloroflexota bacterium]